MLGYKSCWRESCQTIFQNYKISIAIDSALCYAWPMKNSLAATVIAATAPELRRSTLRVLRDSGLWSDRTLDTSFRGCGNRALRRQGEVIDRSCNCTVCVVYGGDCAYQMWRESRGEWHAKRRGVKTRGA